MVLPHRCFKPLAAAAFACGLATSCQADDDRDFLNFLADQQAKIERQAVSPASAESFYQPTAKDMADAKPLVTSAQNAALKDLGGDKLPSKYRQFKTLVFITFGMPEKTLRALFRQAAGNPEIGFVLRGMQTSDMYREIKRVRDLQSAEGEALVFVDPYLFKNYRIDHAPFTLHQARNGRWYGLWGEIAVEGARERIEQGLGGRNRPPVGPLYALKEPDMLEQIRERIENTDWQKIQREAQDRAFKITLDVPLPVAPKDRVRLVEVSSRLQKDVIGPSGQVLAKAGMLINPLEHITLDERYVIFDPTSRSEVEIVERWRKQYPALTLIATHWDARLGAKFDVPVYVLDPLLKKRFGIEFTPSIVEQAGMKVQVTEKRPQL